MYRILIGNQTQADLLISTASATTFALVILKQDIHETEKKEIRSYSCLDTTKNGKTPYHVHVIYSQIKACVKRMKKRRKRSK
jgi:hypothetical protein